VHRNPPREVVFRVAASVVFEAWRSSGIADGSTQAQKKSTVRHEYEIDLADHARLSEGIVPRNDCLEGCYVQKLDKSTRQTPASLVVVSWSLRGIAVKRRVTDSEL
jgi:hypothetical protein